MKILVDIGHPAHVHLFKNMAHEMIKKGHEFFFTVREERTPGSVCLKKMDLRMLSSGKSKPDLSGSFWAFSDLHMKY